MERLRTLAGYLAPPTIKSGLSFFLPAFQVISQRIVAQGRAVFQLWSPNSKLFEYYPGAPAPDYSIDAPLPPKLRRADGHLGRFDPTAHPQVLDMKHLYYPFVRRHASVEEYPEFSRFTDVWDSVTHAFRPGFIERLVNRLDTLQQGLDLDQGFSIRYPNLWATRPRYSLMDSVKNMGAITSRDAALDWYSKIAREAKLTAAWIKFQHAVNNFPLKSGTEMAKLPDAFPLMGAWMNDSPKEYALWLMSLGIPAYFIHQVDTYHDEARTYTASRKPSFLFGTETEKLRPWADAADKAMEDMGWTLSDVVEDPVADPAACTSPWLHRAQSSPHVQGYVCGDYAGPTELSTPCQEMDGYLIPPDVASAQGKGKWQHWQQDVDKDNRVIMVQRHKALDDFSGRVYYDRVLRRMLYLDNRARHPFFYEADVRLFGLPAPDVMFYRQNSQGELLKQKPSLWMYQVKEATRGTVGVKFDRANEKHVDALFLRPSPSRHAGPVLQEKQPQQSNNDRPEAEVSRRSPPKDNDRDMVAAGFIQPTQEPAEAQTARRSPSMDSNRSSCYLGPKVAPTGAYRPPDLEMGEVTPPHSTMAPDVPPVPVDQPMDVDMREPSPPPPMQSVHQAPEPVQSFITSGPVPLAHPAQRDRPSDTPASLPIAPVANPIAQWQRTGGAISQETRQETRQGNRPSPPPSLATGHRGRVTSRERYYRPGGSNHSPPPFTRHRRSSPPRYPVNADDRRRYDRRRSRSPQPRPRHDVYRPIYTGRDRSPEPRPFSHGQRRSSPGDRDRIQPPRTRSRSREARQRLPLPRRSMDDAASSSRIPIPHSNNPAAGPSTQVALRERLAPALSANTDLITRDTDLPLALPADLVPALRYVGTETRFLAISNLPEYFTWRDMLYWVRRHLPAVRRPRVQRILRTIEEGQQVYWIVVQTPTEAATLRGILSDRILDDSPRLIVDFVRSNDYSARASKFRDAWSPRYGMELENRTGAQQSLYDRLRLPDPRRRPRHLPLVLEPPPANYLQGGTDDPY